jgi:hypothetical protein
MTRIIGIDPGSQRTGVGIIDVDDAGKLSHVFHGALAVADEPRFRCASNASLTNCVTSSPRISRPNAGSSACSWRAIRIRR